MRKRDFAMFALVCLLLVIALNQEGSITFEKAFFFAQTSNQQPLLVKTGQADLLPKPIVTDIDGDGYKDLITSSENGKIYIVSLKTISSSLLVHQDLFNPITEEKSFDVNERDKNKGTVHHSIIGLGHGHIKVKKKKGQRGTKRVVAVLSNWKVLCLDHDLNLKWESDLLQQVVSDMKLTDVEIEDLRNDFKPFEVLVALYPWRVHENDEGMVIVGFRKPQEMFENDKRKAEETATQFSYYCFDGATGQIRWKHQSNHKNWDDNEFYEQHSFKLNAQQHLSDSGEVIWREYKKKIMHHLPHVFRHPYDTSAILDNFQPTKKAKVSKIKEREEKHDYGELTEKLKTAVQQITTKVKDTNEKLKKNIELMKRFEKIPNVLVAHLSKGIQVIHLYTGRTLTQFSPLKENTVYQDINFDGMIDAAEAQICKAKIESGAPNPYDTLFRKSVCKLHPTSFAEQFSIPFLMSNEQQEKQSFDDDDDYEDEQMDVVTPALVEHYSTEQKPQFRARDLIYLTSTGLVTAITFDRKNSPNGEPKFRVKWQVMSPSSFRRERVLVESGAETESFFPEIVAFPLRKFETHSFILAVGEKRLTVIDLFGNIQQIIELPHPSIAPIQLVDINGDQVLDIVVTTKQGIYAYITRVHTGMSVLTFLIVSLFVIVGLLYLSTYIQLNDPFYHRKIDRFQK
nr:unnamed protein product [Naegleria fowleri]